jgi:hypothetical protein
MRGATSDKRERGLACSKCAENLINRKIGIFYIEAVPPFFSRLQKKSKKIFEKIEIFGFSKFSIFEIFDSWIFDFCIFDFQLLSVLWLAIFDFRFSTFVSSVFFFFFRVEQKNIFCRS